MQKDLHSNFWLDYIPVTIYAAITGATNLHSNFWLDYIQTISRNNENINERFTFQFLVRLYTKNEMSKEKSSYNIYIPISG